MWGRFASANRICSFEGRSGQENSCFRDFWECGTYHGSNHADLGDSQTCCSIYAQTWAFAYTMLCMFWELANYSHRFSLGVWHRTINFSEIFAHIKYDIINSSLPRRTIVLLKAEAKSALRVISPCARITHTTDSSTNYFTQHLNLTRNITIWLFDENHSSSKNDHPNTINRLLGTHWIPLGITRENNEHQWKPWNKRPPTKPCSLNYILHAHRQKPRSSQQFVRYLYNSFPKPKRKRMPECHRKHDSKWALATDKCWPSAGQFPPAPELLIQLTAVRVKWALSRINAGQVQANFIMRPNYSYSWLLYELLQTHSQKPRSSQKVVRYMYNSFPKPKRKRMPECHRKKWFDVGAGHR